MALSFTRLLAAPILLLNFALYALVLAISGWAINSAIDNGYGSFSVVSDNAATGYVVLFSLIASVVGLASTVTGLHHLTSWRTYSLAGSSAAASIAWSLTLLALGLVAKEIHQGLDRIDRVKALEGFIIILSGTQLLYLLLLNAALVSGEYRKREESSGATTSGGHKPTSTV